MTFDNYLITLIRFSSLIILFRVKKRLKMISDLPIEAQDCSVRLSIQVTANYSKRDNSFVGILSRSFDKTVKVIHGFIIVCIHLSSSCTLKNGDSWCTIQIENCIWIQKSNSNDYIVAVAKIENPHKNPHSYVLLNNTR